MIQTALLKATIAPDTVKADKRTVDLLWYSGAAVKRMDFWSGDEYMLQFSMEPTDVKLDRLNSGAPVLDSHQSFGMENQIGVVERAWIQDGAGYATVRFSERDAVEPIWQDVVAGIFQNISMGAKISQTKDVTPKGEKMRHLLAIDWEPHEVSLVPVGADKQAGFLADAEPLLRLPSGILVFQGIPQPEKVPPTGAPGTEKTAMIADLELRRRINLNRRRLA